MGKDIWTWLHLTDDGLEEADLGLIAEARRLAADIGGGKVGVVVAGEDPDQMLPRLGDYGADAVMHFQSSLLSQYEGELFSRVVTGLLKKHQPSAMLFAHRPQSADLAARLGAVLGWPVITRTVDAHVDDKGRIQAVRPIANGYLFETLEAVGPETVLMTFLPDVLADPRPIEAPPLDIEKIIPELDPETLPLQTVAIIEADPETLALEEADIVVAAGRGAGKGTGFEFIHKLARALGGSVGGTRPVIDDHLLPFERQIGQTGKTVMPHLIINCGISGANEYTAGTEKSQLVIAVNNDPRARIFKFADLGLVGDLHAVLPLLVERLEKMAEHDEA